MTTSNIIELVILIVSLMAAFVIIKNSNQQVADLDGLGVIVKRKDCKGKVIANI